MFDRAEIEVKAGDGGGGVASFRREKFVPFGGPDGGDGGDGGNVIVKADESVSSLKSYTQRRFYKAGEGKNGQGKKKHGGKGENLVLPVPVGTVVSYKTSLDGALIADLEQPGQSVVVARGGKGGWGNVHFATSTNQAPRIAQRGEKGEQATLILELRLIADAGIIGYPNVGKSTLVTAASAARPKIAEYPFTTIEPVLGKVNVGDESFVIAEIPGLIEGAHLGRGLGHDFLHHVLRTKVLIHLVDAGSESPVDDIIKVNNELYLFDSSLAKKAQIVVLNKIDLPEVRSRLGEIEKKLADAGINARSISAATGEGVPELMAETLKMLKRVAVGRVEVETPGKVFRPQPKDREVKVRREGDTFIIEVPELERIEGRGGVTGAEIRQQLKRHFERLGVNRALRRAGIKPGDKVRWRDTEWEW